MFALGEIAVVMGRPCKPGQEFLVAANTVQCSSARSRNSYSSTSTTHLADKHLPPPSPQHPTREHAGRMEAKRGTPKKAAAVCRPPRLIEGMSFLSLYRMSAHEFAVMPSKVAGCDM